MRGSGRATASRGTWVQRSLVVMQAALSLILLTSAGLLTESLRNLENQKYGFETESRVDVRVNPSFNGYSPERLAQVFQRLQARLPLISRVRTARFLLSSPLRRAPRHSAIARQVR